MTLYGSEALGLIFYFLVLPFIALYFFKNPAVKFAITAYWLWALFSLGLILYFYIPTAFAGANLSPPLWAGGLIVLSTLIVVLTVSLTMLGRLAQDYRSQRLGFETMVLIGLTYLLLLIPVMIICSFFVMQIGGYGSYRSLLNHPFWMMPAVFALILELLIFKISLKPNQHLFIASCLFLCLGALLYFWIYIYFHVLKEETFVLHTTFYMKYKTYLVAATLLFVAAIAYPFWRNRNPS